MSTLIRLNYFSGRILTAADFQAEQDYIVGRLRRHNLIAHGAGVASGLRVSISKKDGSTVIVVSPGTGIDPAGNEIELCERHEIPVGLTGKIFLVVVRQVDRPIDHTPALGVEGAMAFARVAEDTGIALIESNPNAEDLILARFIKVRSAWRRDLKIKPKRLR
jgi:hypothetical protein